MGKLSDFKILLGLKALCSHTLGVDEVLCIGFQYQRPNIKKLFSIWSVVMIVLKWRSLSNILKNHTQSTLNLCHEFSLSITLEENSVKYLTWNWVLSLRYQIQSLVAIFTFPYALNFLHHYFCFLKAIRLTRYRKGHNRSIKFSWHCSKKNKEINFIS